MSIDTYPQVDPAITQAFMSRVLGDSSACMVTAMQRSVTAWDCSRRW
jgi:hypothetical protein